MMSLMLLPLTEGRAGRRSADILRLLSTVQLSTLDVTWRDSSRLRMWKICQVCPLSYLLSLTVAMAPFADAREIHVWKQMKLDHCNAAKPL